MRTPLLVYTDTTFQEYLGRLSKSSKKKYRYAMKHNDYSFTHIDYDPELSRKFIRLWEQQSVYGRKAKWCFTMEQMDAMDTLQMFKIGDVAIHCIELCDDYAYAHPPLYNKKAQPELARYIWFKTIEWCCENTPSCLDLGGGMGCDWQSLIKIRHKKHPILEKIRYKWAFVPEDVKREIKAEPVYQLRCNCGWKQLGQNGDECRGHDR